MGAWNSLNSLGIGATSFMEAMSLALSRPPIVWKIQHTDFGNRHWFSGDRRRVNVTGAVRPSYHRVFSKRRWSTWKLSRMLIAFTLQHWVPEGPVALAGDDTVDGHPGRKVYGKGCHRDAIRSTHSMTAYRWGHKWVVLEIS